MAGSGRRTEIMPSHGTRAGLNREMRERGAPESAVFSDIQGQRFYDIVSSGPMFENYVSRGMINRRTWINPHNYIMAHQIIDSAHPEGVNLGPQLIYARPSRRRRRLQDGSDLTRIRTVHLPTRRRCVMYLDAEARGIFHDYMPSGYLFCYRFIVFDEIVD